MQKTANRDIPPKASPTEGMNTDTAHREPIAIRMLDGTEADKAQTSNGCQAVANAQIVEFPRGSQVVHLFAQAEGTAGPSEHSR
ncbi:hypothetical protein CCHR01_03395 [Colletotrichum chrysophilum]|uniref:Uncharacterized protein n=1 Tax=Colletotrichum chrysophilum TaxID=1836956 RepID=A0AAD9AUH3_9PEZI|nr:hypothetical protein CCHR01_03395 [Colletotrichum chrysophilum]